MDKVDFIGFLLMVVNKTEKRKTAANATVSVSGIEDDVLNIFAV